MGQISSTNYLLINYYFGGWAINFLIDNFQNCFLLYSFLRVTQHASESRDRKTRHVNTATIRHLHLD